MTRRCGLPLGIVLTLTVVALAHGQSTPHSPTTPLIGPAVQHNTKGIVTAKGERSLTIRESGGGVLDIVVTPQTRITGLCATFGQVSVSDIVRVDGTSDPFSRVMTAHQVEVLFSAEATERARAKPANRLWQWIRNGGITVDLP